MSTTESTEMRAVLFDVESEQLFCSYYEEHEAALAPRNIWEEDLVRDIVVNRWRQIRISSMEVALVNLEMARCRQLNGREDELTQAVLAYRESIDHSRILQTLSSFNTRYMRNAHQALRLLFDLRKSRPGPEPAPVPQDTAPEPSADTQPIRTSEPGHPPAAPSGPDGSPAVSSSAESPESPPAVPPDGGPPGNRPGAATSQPRENGHGA